jgi:hypothetical protein
MPIADALASLTLETGDYIKNLTKSATYYDDYGWYGSLESLRPGEGYMFNKQASDNLIYPECLPAAASAQKATSEIKPGPDVSFNPNQYEFNGTVTAKVFMNGRSRGSENDQILAYVNGECRGVSESRYFEPAQSYAFPLMVHSNIPEGEIISFRYYDAGSDEVYPCDETLVFYEDMIIADAFESFQLHVHSANRVTDPTGPAGPSLKAYPNPFMDQVHIEYTIEERSKVRIEVYDMLGKVVEYLDERTLDPGTYYSDWNPVQIPGGTYVLKMSSGTSTLMKKIVLIRD